jgi:adenylate cyclase
MGKAWEALGANLDIGVGIDAGHVAMGLVGKRHLEPTVIGDPVNVAQRLESLTKTVGCPLVFSESVRERLHGDIEVVCIDEVTVRGRTTPLRVHGMAGAGAPGRESDRSIHSGEEERTE